MSENATNKNVRDDEIDLLDLFRKMGRTLNRSGKAVGRAFLITIVFLIKRWLPLALSILAGVGVSFLLKTTTESFYTSDMTLRSNAVPTSELMAYINRLHTYCLEKNSLSLSDAISITPQQVKNIIDIDAFWIIDNGNDGIPDYVDYRNRVNTIDSVNVRLPDRLNIRVRVKFPEDLTNIQNGIISYISSDSLFQQVNRLRIRQNRALITRFEYDILLLDSLQSIKYFEETKSRQPQNGGQMIFLQEQRTQLVYSDIYDLLARKQALESERDLYKDIVTVLSDFPLPSTRDNNLSYYGKKFIPFFFFLTLLILILISNRKKLEEVYQKY